MPSYFHTHRIYLTSLWFYFLIGIISLLSVTWKFLPSFLWHCVWYRLQAFAYLQIMCILLLLCRSIQELLRLAPDHEWLNVSRLRIIDSCWLCWLLAAPFGRTKSNWSKDSKDISEVKVLLSSSWQGWTGAKCDQTNRRNSALTLSGSTQLAIENLNEISNHFNQNRLNRCHVKWTNCLLQHPWLCWYSCWLEFNLPSLQWVDKRPRRLKEGRYEIFLMWKQIHELE